MRRESNFCTVNAILRREGVSIRYGTGNILFSLLLNFIGDFWVKRRGMNCVRFIILVYRRYPDRDRIADTLQIFKKYGIKGNEVV